VGLDVHAGSTYAAALDRESGALTRARFGVGSEEVVAWLRELPQPVHACYEAGPTGFALYRAAEAAGVHVDVIAPSKTPRAPGDRVKTDRKDAELWVRLLLAGSLTPVAVPSETFEAARDLARAREQVRADLARVRHRVSKLLLRQGRVFESGSGTWTQQHRRWLGAQHDELWPTVARLRCFRGIETLTALVLFEIGDFARFQRPAQLAAWLRLVPSLTQSGESETRGGVTKTGSGYARRLLVEAAWHYVREPRIRRQPARPPRGPTRTGRANRMARSAPPLPTPPPAARTRQARQHRRRRGRPRARLLPLGRHHGLTAKRQHPRAGGAGAEAAGTRDRSMGSPPGHARS
jgi:transposase